MYLKPNRYILVTKLKSLGVYWGVKVWGDPSVPTVSSKSSFQWCFSGHLDQAYLWGRISSGGILWMFQTCHLYKQHQWGWGSILPTLILSHAEVGHFHLNTESWHNKGNGSKADTYQQMSPAAMPFGWLLYVFLPLHAASFSGGKNCVYSCCIPTQSYPCLRWGEVDIAASCQLQWLQDPP